MLSITHHPYGHFRLPKTIQHFLQLSSNYIKPEQTSVFGANLVLLRAASTNWALVRKLQQPDNHFFFTDTISSVLSRLWALCISRFTSDKKQGDTALPFHLLLQMPLAGQEGETTSVGSGKGRQWWCPKDAPGITCLNQKVPGNITCSWREGQATGESQSRDTVKDNVINVTTAAFDYKDSVKIQNRRVKTWWCTG